MPGASVHARGAGLEPALPLPAPAAAAGETPLPYEGGETRVRSLALRQLNRLISYEAKVLKGNDPDAIHDMRVASRRLQLMLELVYPKPRPPAVRVMRRQLRRCRRVLGEVRNCDVLIEMAGRALGRKRAVRREAWTAVQHYLVSRRGESFGRAMRKFGKLNLALLYTRLKESLAPRTPENHTHHPTAPDFGRQMAAALEPAWTAFLARIAHSLHRPRPETIHAARIAAKRLRYLLEVYREFEIAGSAERLLWLRHLQTHLGDWHDLEVLEQMVLEMLARPEFLRDQLPLAIDVEKLLLLNRRHKAGLEAKFVHIARESDEMNRLKEWASRRLREAQVPCPA